MNMTVPILYVIIIALVVGALCAIAAFLVGRKHPKAVEAVVADAKGIAAGVQAAGKKSGL
jgi:hypothetical protein